MGGHDAGTQHQFTGIAKYFNSYTIIGRRNVSLQNLYMIHTHVNCILKITIFLI